MPPQLARCDAEGNGAISTPISATNPHPQPDPHPALYPSAPPLRTIPARVVRPAPGVRPRFRFRARRNAIVSADDPARIGDARGRRPTALSAVAGFSHAGV